MAAIAAYEYTFNCTNTGYLPYDILGGTSKWKEIIDYFSYNPWIFSLLGSTIVGLTGIFPIWLIPIQDGVDLKTGENSDSLKILLSFAVGALLGDIFLHLLPEAFENQFHGKIEDGHTSNPAGLHILSAFMFFIIVEKLVSNANAEKSVIPEQQIDKTSTENEAKEMDNNNCIMITNTKKNNCVKECLKNKAELQCIPEKQHKNGFRKIPNGIQHPRKNGFKEPDSTKSALASECPNDGPLVDEAKNCLKKLAKTNSFTAAISRANPPCAIPPNNIVHHLNAWTKKHTHDLFRKLFDPKAFPGYLNLLMNFLDNFTHGLSVGGSFLISFRVGVLSTFTILMHEIPHEVADFAILLNSGFSKWGAARAQLITASGGIVGALTAVSFSSVEERTSWILPLTIGGFLHIAMVTILPDLLKETNTKQSLKQLGVLLFGIIVRAVLMYF